MLVENAAWYKKQQYRKVCVRRLSLLSICLVMLLFVCFTVIRVMAMENGETTGDVGELKDVANRSEESAEAFPEKRHGDTGNASGAEIHMQEPLNMNGGNEVSGKETELPDAEKLNAEMQHQEVADVTVISEESPYIVAIDAGHGGMDEGCSFEGVEEKTVNLKLAGLLQDKLNAMGFETVLVRKEDECYSLQERAKSVKETGADILVSLHQNSCEDEKVNGVETWYYGEKEESRRLARLVQEYTVLYSKAKNRGTAESENLYLLRECGVPACLVETGFLSNEAERKKLLEDDYLDRLAQGIADGVELYFYPKTMYLTFDDGPNTENTNAVLDILKEKNVKATFFLVGKNVERNSETARRIVAEGHTIGIHCYNHDYHQLYQDVESYVADFEKAKKVIYEVTGVETKLFRFPGGSINSYNEAVYKDIIRVMTESGYVYFDWNASLEDAVKKPVAEKLLKNAKESTLGRKQVVMLAHDTVDATVECLEELLDLFPEYEMKVLEEGVQQVHF